MRCRTKILVIFVFSQLSPYPEVKKLVAEGDVSYDDALVMVGLKKPSGESAFGGYQPSGSKNGAIFYYEPGVKVGEHHAPVGNDPEVNAGRPGADVGREAMVKVRAHDAPGGREPEVETDERDAKEVDADRRGIVDSREAEEKPSEQDLPGDREVNNHEEANNADRNDSAGGNEVEEKVVVEPKESREKKHAFIRRARTESVKKRKHAGDVFRMHRPILYLSNHKPLAPITRRSCARLDPHRRRNRPGNQAIRVYEGHVCYFFISLL